MVKQETERRISTLILDDFKRGLAIDQHLWEMARQLADIESMADLVRRVSSDPDSDVFSVLSMLLFPTRSLQLRLEPILQRRILSRADAEAIGSMLIDQRASVWLIYNQKRYPVDLQPSMVSVFLERLHLTWVLDKNLLQMLHHRLGRALWKEGAVRFRNGRIPRTALQSHLIMQFLKEATDSTSASGWLDQIDFLIDTVPENPPQSSFWEFIEDRRRFWLQMYGNTLESHRLLAQHNVETLMMARTPIGALTQDEILRRIEMHENILNQRRH